MDIGSIAVVGHDYVLWAGRRWLMCDGRQVSRLRYWRLYRRLRVAYGRGNGRTTFNLPDLRRRA